MDGYDNGYENCSTPKEIMNTETPDFPNSSIGYNDGVSHTNSNGENQKVTTGCYVGYGYDKDSDHPICEPLDGMNFRDMTGNHCKALGCPYSPPNLHFSLSILSDQCETAKQDIVCATFGRLSVRLIIL